MNEYKNNYYSESLSDFVRNINVKDRIIEYKGELLQQIDPIYHDPEAPEHIFDYRTHFFAPTKHFAGFYFDTYGFNLTVIWMMTLLFYFTLYFELLRKALSSFDKVKLFKKKE